LFDENLAKDKNVRELQTVIFSTLKEGLDIEKTWTYFEQVLNNSQLFELKKKLA